MNHQEKVKTDNYAAQYNKIISNINENNRKLEAILSSSLKATTNLNFIRSEIVKETQRLESLRASSSNIEDKRRRQDQRLNDKEAAINVRSLALDLQAQIINGKKTGREEQEDKYLKQSHQELHRVNEEMKRVESIMSANKAELDTFADVKAEIIKDIKRIRKQRNEQDLVLNQNIKDLDSLKSSKEKEALVVSKRIEELYKEEAVAVESIKVPDQMLAQRQQELSDKERDIGVLTRRWKKFLNDNGLEDNLRT